MRIVTILFSMMVLGVSHADLAWEAGSMKPKVKLGEGGEHLGHGGRGSGKTFRLLDSDQASIQLWLPTGGRRLLDSNESGQVSVNGTGMDNYHLLIAKRRGDGLEEVALRYVYQNGKPSGESPSSLVRSNKAMLDILPSPLPREHQRYLSQKTFNFIVRFNGEALGEQRVRLETGNGTTLDAVTDRRGGVGFVLPDDFPEVRAGRRNNPPSEFVITAEHAQGEMLYPTTLSGAYYVNPNHWRSTGGALLAMSMGLVSGVVVLRRYRNFVPPMKGGKSRC